MKKQRRPSIKKTQISSCATILSKSYCPSESFLKIKSYLAKHKSEIKSSKLSPYQSTQATIKSKNTPSRSLYLQNLISKDASLLEIHSASTRASLYCNPSTDRSKTPSKLSPPSPSPLILHSQSRSATKTPDKYLLKPWKPQLQQASTESLIDLTSTYFAGVSLVERKRAVEDFSCKSCSLEYVLEGNKNSVNCMESFAEQLWSGGSDCSVRCWALPSSTAGPYTSSIYPRGTVLQQRLKVGTHHKPVRAIARCWDLMASASSDGVVKLWTPQKKLIRSIRIGAGIRCMKSLSSTEVITAGSALEFTDIASQKSFREAICTMSVVNSLVVHSSFTFIIGCEDSALQLWDIRAQRCISSYDGHKDAVTGVALDSRSNLISCSIDKTVKEWDLRTGLCRNNRKATYNLREIAVNGDSIITAGEKLLLWKEKSFEVINGHTGSVKNLHFSPQNDMLFAAGCDERVTAWSLN